MTIAKRTDITLLGALARLRLSTSEDRFFTRKEIRTIATLSSAGLEMAAHRLEARHLIMTSWILVDSGHRAMGYRLNGLHSGRLLDVVDEWAEALANRTA